MIALKEHRVTLKEDEGDTFTLVSFCAAEDEDHAEEQALDAYPAGSIVNITSMGVYAP